MSKEILNGYTVDQSVDRILSKGKELSAKPKEVSVKLELRKSGSFFKPVLVIKVKTPKSKASNSEIELDSKIPPSTGVKNAKKKATKRR